MSEMEQRWSKSTKHIIRKMGVIKTSQYSQENTRIEDSF